MNPKVMVAAAKYDIGLSSTTKIVVDLLNIVCDQEWTVEEDFELEGHAEIEDSETIG